MVARSAVGEVVCEAGGLPPLSFDFVPQVPVVVQRHEGQLTSDAGLLPVRQLDEAWGYTARLAACVGDARADPEHPVVQMVRQRVYGLLADYEDCNDHDDLRDDAVFKLVAGSLPRGGDPGDPLASPPLASQPTLCRFENAVSIPALYALLDFLVETGVERLKERNGGVLPARVTLDLDATDDPAHGHQQLVLFHGFYGQHQYYPVVVSEPTTRHVFAVWLRHGTAHAALGAEDDLARVVAALRRHRPDVAVHVRGDAAFGIPRMYAACEAYPGPGGPLSYTFGLATNPRLRAMAQPLLDRAAAAYAATGEKQRLFVAFLYRAEGWEYERTVVAKAECHGQGTNLRFVVTDEPVFFGDEPAAAGAQRAYDEYVRRGESEHRMDELKNGLHAGRLSCHRFVANFWRLVLHAASYNLLNALRDHPAVPRELQAAQPQTWRTRVIKAAAEVVRTTRRVVVRLAAQWPHWDLYQAVARSIPARARALGAIAPTPIPAPSP
jgi:hypothetical protein